MAECLQLLEAFMAVTVESVDAAICSIQENGQSFTLDGVTYNAATLSTLYQYRDTLLNQEARASGARPVFRAVNLSGMGY
jgi:hypothetical protein